jgi:hypothetical protein
MAVVHNQAFVELVRNLELMAVVRRLAFAELDRKEAEMIPVHRMAFEVLVRNLASEVLVHNLALMVVVQNLVEAFQKLAGEALVDIHHQKAFVKVAAFEVASEVDILLQMEDYLDIDLDSLGLDTF